MQGSNNELVSSPRELTAKNHVMVALGLRVYFPAGFRVGFDLGRARYAINWARFSFSEQQRLGDHLVLGSHTEDANYCIGISMFTEDPEEAKGWLPGGQLREDVFTLLRVYLGCDYDASLKLTIPIKLSPLPRLGDRSLLMGYNVVMGLREDNLDEMPEKVTMKLGRIRDKTNENRARNDKAHFVVQPDCANKRSTI